MTTLGGELWPESTLKPNPEGLDESAVDGDAPALARGRIVAPACAAEATAGVPDPVEGGDASLVLAISEPLLRELTPKEQVREGGTLAFRRQVADSVYSLSSGSDYPKSKLPAIYAGFRDHDGWAPAAEPHQTEEEQAAFCRKYIPQNEGLYRTTSFLGRPKSFFEVAMEKFHSLAYRNGARLVIVIDPFPCRPSDEWLSRRQIEAARFLKTHSDVVLYPKDLYEKASPDIYSIPIHILPEFHGITTRRVGRVLQAVVKP